MFHSRLLAAPYYGPETNPTSYGESSVLGGYYGWDGYDQDFMIADYLRGWLLATPLASARFAARSDYGTEQLRGSVGKDRHQFRNVVHAKTRLVNLPHSYVISSFDGRYSENPLYKAPYLRVASTVAPPTSSLLGCTSIIEGIDRRMDGSAAATAFWSMRPRFQGNLDLLRSLAELKDFRDCLSIYGKAYPSFLRLLRSVRSTFGRHHAAANLYLAKKLAIDPTIADFIKVAIQSTQTAHAAQLRYAELGGVWQSSHFTEGWVTVLQSGSRGTGNNYIYGNGTCASYKKTATLAYKYKYAFRTPWDTIKQYWGLEITLDNIYQLIPFSFVVDMFATIGNSIRYMKTDSSTKLSEVQYCESFKAKAGLGTFIRNDTRKCRFVVNREYFGFRRPPVLLQGWEASLYDRRVVDPNWGPALPKMKMPSSGQAVTLLALARCFLQ